MSFQNKNNLVYSIIGHINKHILGLIGITILCFMLLYNLKIANLNGLDNTIHLGRLDKSIILMGMLLLVMDLIPERIKNSLSKHSFFDRTDELVNKYGTPLIILLIVIGFIIRFVDLGKLSFQYDELITTYAAIDLLQNGYQGLQYTRAILNTSFIALSVNIFGVSEFSGRLISVIFGTLTIPLVYLLGIRLANKRVAILATLLITFSGWEILWSREARMYAQLQFFYLLASYLFYLGLNNDKNKKKLLMLSMIATLLAFLSERLALAFLPVAFIYILIYKKNMFLNRNFIYACLSIMGILFIFLTGKFSKPILDIVLMRDMPGVPLWGRNPIYYYAVISDLNILFFLVLIGIMASIIVWKAGLFKLQEKNAYLLLNFFIPFIIVSLYPWRIDRYSFFIFPFLVILASGIVDLYIIGKCLNPDNITKISGVFGMKKNIIYNIKYIFLSLLFILFVTQFLLFFVYQPSDAMHLNWKKGSEYVKSHLDKGDKIATTSPLHGDYYVGKVDFVIKQYDDFGEPLENMNSSYGIYLYNYPFFLRTIEMNKGWMIVDNIINTHQVDTRVRDFILNNMTYHPEGSEDTLRVYSWNKNKRLLPHLN